MNFFLNAFKLLNNLNLLTTKSYKKLHIFCKKSSQFRKNNPLMPFCGRKRFSHIYSIWFVVFVVVMVVIVVLSGDVGDDDHGSWSWWDVVDADSCRCGSGCRCDGGVGYHCGGSRCGCTRCVRSKPGQAK